MTFQKIYWENKKVLKRRHPSHPVIQAFAKPKVDLIIEQLNNDLYANDNKEMMLLDVGSGNGYISYYLDRYFNVTCVDFSHNILTACPIEKRVQALATDLPFRDGYFDIVFCSNLLHHLDDPVAVLKEMARVSNCYVAVLEPNRANPLMFSFSFVSKADKGLRKFSKKYLISICEELAEYKIKFITATGVILPNTTPLFFLPLIKIVEFCLFPKLFHLLILEKNTPSNRD